MPAVNTDKKCYRLYTTFTYINATIGGKIVWLTDNELLIAEITHPRRKFKLVVEEDIFEKYGKYIDATID